MFASNAVNLHFWRDVSYCFVEVIRTNLLLGLEDLEMSAEPQDATTLFYATMEFEFWQLVPLDSGFEHGTASAAFVGGSKVMADGLSLVSVQHSLRCVCEPEAAV